MIPERFISQLLDRADIVDVVGRYVPLKKAGKNYQACCPFHKEKTPSFSVSPTKQFYKCFGCGVSGNAIGFLMRYEGLEFPEAVEKLAGFYGMDVPKERRSPRDIEREVRQKSLTEYMADAARYYASELSRSEKAINYLKGRGITGETAAKFGLGYAPEGWHALQKLWGDRYSAPELVECGLLIQKNDKRYDAYRDRLMFPIRNVKGQVIGFGARTFKKDEQPKYINSPETPIYHKGRELYGLYEGREFIHRKGRAIVCEGYMDVIQLSQAGFEESVAALGTSITSEHVQKLLKISDKVYFSFDGDTAGRKAARRALEAALPVITDVQKASFILLPPEHDPDSLIKAEGPEAFEREIRRALGLVDFAKSVLLEGKDLLYAEDRAKVVAEGKAFALQLTNAPMLRIALIEEIAGIARVSSDEILRQYGLMAAAPAPATSGGRFSSYGSGFSQGDYGSRRNFGGQYGGSYGGNYGDRYGTQYGGRYERFGRNRWGRDRWPAEPKVAVTDFRERILQCLLAHPTLINEFGGVIEEEFLGSTQPVAQQIIEVWRAAAVLEDEAPGANHAATLLSILSESDWANVYEELLAGEMLLDTPEECARLEVRRNFLTLELERLKLRMQTFHVRDEEERDAFQKLLDRKIEVERLLAETQKAEFQYRVRRDMEKSYEYLQQRDRKERHGGGMVLDKNPKVRALQEMLFGMKAEDEEKKLVSPEGLTADAAGVTDGARKTGEAPKSAVVEALTALRSRRHAAPENGVSAGESWLDEAAPLPDDVPADMLANDGYAEADAADLEEEDVPFTFDDDTPNEFE